MQTQINITIDTDQAGQRADVAIAAHFSDFSREQIKKWIQEEKLHLNDKPFRPKDKVFYSDRITGDITIQTQTDDLPEAIALDVIYEDDDILVINKPAGLVTHPGAGNPSGTLLNGLLYYCQDLEQLPRAGIVHRLDKDTSGLMMVAKTKLAYLHLIDQLKARDVKREYDALVLGEMIAGGTVDAAITRSHHNRLKMAVAHNGGKEAITQYFIKTRYQGLTLVECQLKTGRTHQIRVHMAHINHPLIGDQLYGKAKQTPKAIPEEIKQALRGFNRQALHAKRLSFIHPKTADVMSYQTPCPDDFATLLDALEPIKSDEI